MLPRTLNKGIFLTFSWLTIFSILFAVLPVAPVFADGEAGSAMSFDGADDYVFLGETNMIMGGTSWRDTKSVSLWIKPEGVSMACSDPSRCDAVFGDRPRWWGISRGIVNGEDRIWVWNFDGNTDYVGVKYSVNEWVQIALVHNGGLLSVYKNGQLGGTVNSGTTDQPNTGGLPNLQIGGVIVGTTNYWAYEGDIDEVRIYNTALSPVEIQNTLFDELVGNETGLVAYYPMNILDSGKLPDQRVDALGDPVLDPHDGTLFGTTLPPVPFLTSSSAFDKPLTMDQRLTTNEDTSKTIVLFGADKQNDPLTFIVETPPTHGVLSGSGQNLTYTPDMNYFGMDSFTYTVRDASHTSAPGVIMIQVLPVNDPPLADDLNLSTPVNTPLDLVLTGSDLEGSALNFHVSSLPLHGLISGDPPNLTYTPNSGFVGTDQFTFDVFDHLNASDTGTVTIQVESVNAPPVAISQSLTTDEDTALPLILTATDAEGDPVVFNIVSGPSKGELSGTLPNLVYTPDADQNGSDSFTFYASDAEHDGPLATVAIEISPVNDAPIANNLSLVTNEDTPLSVTLSGSDVDGDQITTVVVTPPIHGSLSGMVPNLTYTPEADFNGSDQFTFRVNDGLLDSVLAVISIEVLPLNDAPLANPQTLNTNEDTPLNILLSGSDVDGDQITYQLVNLPGFGGISGTPPNLIYTPSVNFYGEDQFTFQVNDGLLNSTTAAVTITVNAINDAPLADADEIFLGEDGFANFVLGGSDVDGDGLNFVITDFPDFGQISGTIPNLTYTPILNFNGTDSLTFRSNDGVLNSTPAVITFNVNAVNDAPLAANLTLGTAEDTPISLTLSGSDVDGDPISFINISSPAHGVLSGTAPNLLYTPDADYQGSDQFTYQVFDGFLASAPAVVTIQIAAVNDPPTANAQTLSVDEDTPLLITLTGSDPENAPLTFSTLVPLHGTLSGTAPNLTYIPDADYYGQDQFSFTVSDGVMVSVPAQILITINPVNDLPVADEQTIDTGEDTPLNITLTGSDADGDQITFQIVDPPLHGSFDGTAPELSYTPDENYFGEDQFTFQVNDGSGDSALAVVMITVNAINDQPSAAAQDLLVAEDTNLPILLSGDDAEGDPLVFTVVDLPLHGQLTGTAPDLIYTPDENYFGEDQFTFMVNDGELDSLTTPILITVTPVADAPFGTPDTYQVTQDQTLTVDQLTGVLHNDQDGDGDLLTAELVDDVSFGVLLLNEDGSFEYTPQSGFIGEDQFVYRAFDGVLYSLSITVTITVLPEIPVTSGFQIYLPLITK